MLIAGDIGATYARIALVTLDNLELVALRHYHSSDFPNFASVIERFLDEEDGHEIQAAAFALPGPVKDGVCHTTNIPWKIVDQKELQQRFGWKHLFLLNDVEGHAWTLTLPLLSDVETVVEGKKREGNRALIAPGTGLGEAGVLWNNKHYYAFASEGGHCDFAPCNELQIELFYWLNQKYPHVSYERVLSGPGMVTIYEFFKEIKKLKPLDEHQEDLGLQITLSGVKGENPCSTAAVDLFISILGSEVSNLALKFMAHGGIYIGGGIAPNLLPKLKSTLFRESYLDKGRFVPLLEEIGVGVLKDKECCIRGAARYAIVHMRG